MGQLKMRVVWEYVGDNMFGYMKVSLLFRQARDNGHGAIGHQTAIRKTFNRCHMALSTNVICSRDSELLSLTSWQIHLIW